LANGEYYIRTIFLKHKKVVFTTLLAKGKLWQLLADIDAQAQQMFNNLVDQIKKVEGVSEQLKAENQIEWVQRLNNNQQRSTENVLKELIYKQITALFVCRYNKARLTVFCKSCFVIIFMPRDSCFRAYGYLQG